MKDKKLIKPEEAAVWFYDRLPEFGTMKVCVDAGIYLVSNFTTGCYDRCGKIEFGHKIYILLHDGYEIFVSALQIENRIRQLGFTAFVQVDTVNSRRYIGFLNGVLERSTHGFHSLDPRFRVTSLVPFNNTPGKYRIPKFDTYLDPFTKKCGSKKEQCIRS